MGISIFTTAASEPVDTATAQTITGAKSFEPGKLLMRSALDGTFNEPYSDSNAPASLEMTQASSPVTPPAGEATLFTPDAKLLGLKAPDGGVLTMINSSFLRGRMQFLKTAGATSGIAVGMVAPTLTTATNGDDTDGRWFLFSTTSTSGNASGAATLFTVTQRNWQGDSTFLCKTGTDVTLQRVWVGWSNGSADASSTPALHLAAFRYDPSISTSWQCVTSAGTSTQTVTTVPGAVTAGQICRLRINMTLTSVEFYVNDALVATHTTNLPTATQLLGYIVRVVTLSAAVRTFRFARMALLDRG